MVRLCRQNDEQEAERLTDRGFDRSPIGDRRGLFVRFGVSKQNYDATPLDRWYQRHSGGCCCLSNYRMPSRKTGRAERARAMTQQRIKPAYAKFDPAHVFDGLFVPNEGEEARAFVR